METEVFATVAASSPVHGAAVVRHQNKECLVSIGGDLSASDNAISPHYLQIRVLHTATTSWKSYAVATNGIFNRAYHAAATLGEDIYVFGGENLAQKPSRFYTLPRQAEHEILKINKGFFGYKANVITPTTDLAEDHLALVGLSANIVGKQGHLQHILLFGGYHPSYNQQIGKYSQDISLFTLDAHGAPVIKAVEIDAASPRPPPRTFHSTAVIGPDNAHLIAFGGHNSDHPDGLLDLWVLDMTEVLISLDPSLVPSAIIEPAATGKGAKTNAKADKNAPKTPTAVWTQVTVDLSQVLPRYKANFEAVPVDGNNGMQYRLLVFGGCSTGNNSSISCPLLQYHESLLSLAKDNNTGGLTASATAFIEPKSFTTNNDKLNNITGYGASSSLLFDTDYPASSVAAANAESTQQPLGIVIFGGDRAADATLDETLVTIFDPSTTAAKRLKKILRRGKKSSSNNNHEKNKDNAKMKRLMFENGDEYYGEVHDTRRVSSPSTSPASASRGVSASQTRILNPMLSTSLDTTEQEPDEENEEEESEEGIIGIHIPHGNGFMTYANGDKYEGLWTMNQRQGPNGKLTKDNGRWIYEGDFRHDLPHGTGHSYSTLNNVQSHTGEYKDGLYEGHGELTDDTNNTYTGSFRKGIKHGQGTLTNADSDMKCVGTWEDDRMIGHGTAVNLPIRSFNLSLGYAPQETPLSQYENNLLTKSSWSLLSQNVLKIQAGMLPLQQFHAGRYTGPIFNGKPQGEDGLCTYEDASVYRGSWKNGRRNGLGVYDFAINNNSKYEGKFVGDKRSGNGRVTGPHGLEYDGLWQDNAPSGMGLLFDYEAGTVYEGEFKAGLKEGSGILRDLKHGRVLIDSQWVHGHPLSQLAAGVGEGQQSLSPASVAVSGGLTLGKGKA